MNRHPAATSGLFLCPPMRSHLLMTRRLWPAALLLTLILSNSPSWAGLMFEFDYRFDSLGFFDDPARREALEAAGRMVNRYVDNLEAIIPSGNNTWMSFLSKPDGSGTEFFGNETIPQDVIVFYPAGRPLPGLLAQAIDLAPVGQGDPAWEDTVAYRGQAGAEANPATDVGPAGGTISFNNNLAEVPWHFDLTTNGLAANEFDFITVAAHEIAHVLGIGTARSWVHQTNANGQFTGPQAVHVGSPTNPTLQLDPSEGHWQKGTKSIWNGKTQEALFAPGIFPGKRAFLTTLDRAALRDLGWEEATAGDANLDREFTSRDMIAVFQVGLYETGQFAGWTDGDWNNNGTFESADMITAMQTGTYEQGPQAAIAAAAMDTSNIVRLGYDPEPGRLVVESMGSPLTTFSIESSLGVLRPELAKELDGPFDVSRSDKIFKLGVDGFSSWDAGEILPVGLSVEQLQAEFSLDGSLAGGGGLPAVVWHIVPEPNTAWLLASGGLIFSVLRRYRR